MSWLKQAGGLAAIAAAVLSITPSAAMAQARGGAVQGDRAEVALPEAPHVVGPGVISRWPAELAFAVDPRTGDAYYTITDGAFTRMTIVRARADGPGWTAPDVAEFSGVWSDGDPAVAPNGNVLVFISNRPRDGGRKPRPDLDLWRLDRRADGGWSAPVPLPDGVNTDRNEYLPSISLHGNLYFGREGRIYRISLRAGDAASAEVLPFEGFAMAAVSPDERLLVLVGPGEQPRETDLFVAFHRNGSWSAPRRFAAPVNSTAIEIDPSFSPDGATLYFASERRNVEAPTWPRPERIDAAGLESELQETVHNGLRNIYAVDVTALYRQGVPGPAGGS